MTQENPLIGTWRLVSWEVVEPDGSVRLAYGDRPVGFLTYTPEGFMSAEIMDADRGQSDPGFPAEWAVRQTLPDADRARAYSSYLSYCGPYTFDGEGSVIHHVRAGLIPGWLGTEQKRRFTFEGGRLIIGRGTAQVLTWERWRAHG